MNTPDSKNEFVTGDEALALIPFPLDKGSMVRMSRTGKFPAIAVAINERRFLWLRAEVEAWARERWPNDPKDAKRDPASKHAKVPRRGS